MADERYTVQVWGTVYRSYGQAFGIKSEVAGLGYQDVCEQIVHVSRRGDSVRILDGHGKLLSVGQFKMD